MTRPQTRRSRLLGGGSPAWVLGGTGINAVATYALLLVVARVLGPARTADFSVFWALSVVAGLGFFLPLEQETARRVARVARSAMSRSVWRRAMSIGAAIAAVLAVLGLIGWWSATEGPVIALAFAVACAGYAIQFPSRGQLSGRRRLARYGLVPALDAVLRMALIVVLAVTGVRSVAAYDAAVAVSALVTGLVAVILSRSGETTRATAEPAGDVIGLARDALRLVLAAACMQALLNNGTLVARFFATPDQQDLAGRLLVVMTIARLPVFLFQSLQATYLTRLSAGMHGGDRDRVVGILRLLVLAVLTLGGLLTIGAAVAGPWAVTFFFTAKYAVSRTAVVLVAASVATYLIASVANDVSVAVGAHRRIALAWPAGLVCALAAALTISNLTVRSTVPLGLGALVAAAILLPGVMSRVRLLPAHPPRKVALS